MIRIFPILLLFASLATAAPPEVPREIKARPGQMVRVVAKGEGEIGFARSFGDDDAFFDELAIRPGQRRYVFQSDKAGTYYLAFWTKGELEGSSCIIVVGDGKPAPVPPVKPGDPPPVTPPTPTALYFLIVRADGPASPAFTATMGLPAWDAIRKAGHSVKDRTVSEVAPLGYTLPPGTMLPVVFTLDNSGPRSKILRGPSPLPTDANGIGLLPTEVK